MIDADLIKPVTWRFKISQTRLLSNINKSNIEKFLNLLIINYIFQIHIDILFVLLNYLKMKKGERIF